jgi:GNAT superfamily N-acetyltransferase
MGGMLEIRLLEEADAGVYRELRLEALQGEPLAFGSAYADYAARSLEQIREQLKPQAEARFTLGAFQEGRLVGMATLVRHEGTKFRHTAGVYAVYVQPAARGQGISRRLMHTLIEKARTFSGLEQLTLAVSTHQQAARQLYRSLGFEVWGYEKRALKVGQTYTDFEHMVLWLG